MTNSDTTVVETPTTIEQTYAAAAPAPKVFTRDMIRTAILDSKGETEIVEAFGVQIELRTPALEELLQYRNSAEDNSIMARAIANNCYVPGSDEKVFDEADVAYIMKLKWTADMKRLNTAVTKILAGDEAIQAKVEDQTKSHQA